MPSILLRSSALCLALPSFKPSRMARGVARRPDYSGLRPDRRRRRSAKGRRPSSAPAQAEVTMARSRRRAGAKKSPACPRTRSGFRPAIAIPRTGMRVVWTLGVTMATFEPTSHVDQRGFARIGRADNGGKAAASGHCAITASSFGRRILFGPGAWSRLPRSWARPPATRASTTKIGA